MHRTPKSEILFPLYIFPDPGCWSPLYAAISANPTLRFTIIVNPNSGPGSPPWWPNEDYVREIPKLNAYPNVTTVGYVAVDYCRRKIEDVYADIEAYAAWSRDSGVEGLGVNGIFFDETPNLYSEDVKLYLDDVTRRVKESCGIGGDRLVIHNPGTAVDRRLTDPGPDVTAVVEESYAKFESQECQEWLATSTYDRSRSCYIVHSVPVDRVSESVKELRERAGFVFVTDLSADCYSGFGKSWGHFVGAMAVE